MEEIINKKIRKLHRKAIQTDREEQRNIYIMQADILLEVQMEYKQKNCI